MATFHGVGVNFGISSSLAAITGAFQTRDHTYGAEMEEVTSGYGEVVATATYKFANDATFEYVATGAGPSGTIVPTLPTVGALLTITDLSYTQIAATNWIVTKVSTKGSNTSALKVTCDLKQYALITS